VSSITLEAVVDRETVADAFAGSIERFDLPSEHGDGG